MEWTPFKASIAVLRRVAITGAGLGVMIWQAIDVWLCVPASYPPVLMATR